MRHYLIATHGMLASGYRHTLGMLAGGTDRLEIITAYMENISVEQLAAAFFQKLKTEDEVVVFTDILGGSVNQYFTGFLDRPHFHLIAGVNLPIIISILYLSQEKYLDDLIIRNVLEESRSQMVYMNQYINQVVLDDETEC